MSIKRLKTILSSLPAPLHVNLNVLPWIHPAGIVCFGLAGVPVSRFAWTCM